VIIQEAPSGLLSFLVPGVAAPKLPPTFAASAAYGDLVAAVLAVVAAIALARLAFWAIGVVWFFNVWGTADLLSAFDEGAQVRLDAGMLGATFFIPISRCRVRWRAGRNET
jgi:hypothetical protein